MELGDRGLKLERRPVADFRPPQFDGFQRRTETEHGQVAQRAVVKSGNIELFQLRQHLLGVLGFGAGIFRLMRGVERARLEAQLFGLIVDFHLDAVLVSPQAEDVFNEQFGPEAFFQRPAGSQAQSAKLPDAAVMRAFCAEAGNSSTGCGHCIQQKLSANKTTTRLPPARKTQTSQI
jgi:hypothetical protein